MARIIYNKIKYFIIDIFFKNLDYIILKDELRKTFVAVNQKNRVKGFGLYKRLFNGLKR